MSAVKAVNNYGLDAELAAKANAKYDPQLEREAQSWIESMTGIRLTRGFGPSLQNGVILAKLMNRLRPGSIKVYEGDAPFKQMENVSAFIQCARRMGVAESDLFTTVALFEQKNIAQVVLTVLALKRIHGGGSKGVGGPQQPKAFAPSRTDASVSKLNNGSKGFMDANKPAPVFEANRGSFGWAKKGGKPGSNPNASVSLLNSGSYGVMQSTVERTPMTEANRAQFATSTRPKSAAPRTVDRGPNSQYGVARTMPWEKPLPSSPASKPASSSLRRSWKKSLRLSWRTQQQEKEKERERERQNDPPPQPPKPAAQEYSSRTMPTRRKSTSLNPLGYVSKFFTTNKHRPGGAGSSGASKQGGRNGNVRSLRRGYDSSFKAARTRQGNLPQQKYPSEENDPKEKSYANFARYR